MKFNLIASALVQFQFCVCTDIIDDMEDLIISAHDGVHCEGDGRTCDTHHPHEIQSVHNSSL